MFLVTGLKILVRLGTHNFFVFFFFFFLKNIMLCILKGISPFKMHEMIYFSRKPEKILGFTSKFDPKHRYFCICPSHHEVHIPPMGDTYIVSSLLGTTTTRRKRINF